MVVVDLPPALNDVPQPGSDQRGGVLDYVISEVNRADVYKNCTRVEQLDELLGSYNLKRVETSWDGSTWGDALYVRGGV